MRESNDHQLYQPWTLLLDMLECILHSFHCLFMANYCFVAYLIVSLLFLNFVLKFCLVKIDVFYISSDPCIVYPVGATTKLYPICHL